MAQSVVIEQDGTIRIDGFDPKDVLKYLQSVVDGYIEPVGLGDGLTMWVNEDGLYRSDLKPNDYAGLLGAMRRGMMSHLVGNVVITRDDEDGNTVSLTEGDVKHLVTILEGLKREIML
jgi:hypothetical protein